MLRSFVQALVKLLSGQLISVADVVLFARCAFSLALQFFQRRRIAQVADVVAIALVQLASPVNANQLNGETQTARP